MLNSAPYEIIAAPFTLYLATIGTAMPNVDAAPSGSWTKVGTSGDLNYGEDGVTVEHAQEMEFFRSLGSTGPRKAFRKAESLIIRMILVDLSLEHYAIALNHNTITTDTAGVGDAGDKTIGLTRGLGVVQKALLARADISPYGDAFKMQYYCPVVVVSSSPKPVFRKNEPAGLELEFTALENPSAATEAERFGILNVQNAAAS